MKLCDNGVKAHLGQPIFSPACYRETPATHRVEIGYVNCIGDVFDTDVLYLCGDCLKLARRSVRRSGYKIKVERIGI